MPQLPVLGPAKGVEGAGGIHAQAVPPPSRHADHRPCCGWHGDLGRGPPAQIPDHGLSSSAFASASRCHHNAAHWLTEPPPSSALPVEGIQPCFSTLFELSQRGRGLQPGADRAGGGM